MKKLFLFFMCLAFGLSMLHAESDKTPITKDDKWEKKNDRDIIPRSCIKVNHPCMSTTKSS